MSAEEWRPVEGFEGSYEVSNHGQVRGPRGWVLSPFMNKTRRSTVQLSSGNSKHTFYVRDLVVAAFVGQPEGAGNFIHIDRDPMNCRVDNLRWISDKPKTQAERCGKPVTAYRGGEEHTFPTFGAFERVTGISRWRYDKQKKLQGNTFEIDGWKVTAA